MHMLDPVCIFFHHFQRIYSAVREMSRVKQKAYIFRVGILHHAVHFRLVLHHRPHVVMEGQRDAVFLLRDLSEPVHSAAESLPFFIVHYVFMAEYRRICHALYAVALLGSSDHLCPHGLQISQLAPEILFHLFKRLCDQETGKPLVADLHSPQLQRLFQDVCILGIFISHLGTGKSRQRHFADALFKCVLLSKVRHVVVGPCDGGDPQFYFFFTQHFYFLLFMISNLQNRPVSYGLCSTCAVLS